MSNKNQEDQISQGLNLLAKTSVIVFIGIIFSKIFMYLYRIIIARYFGPEVYGLFSLAIMVIGWFVAISALGFNVGVVRYISLYNSEDQKQKIKYLVKKSAIILFITSIISASLLFFLSRFISVNFFHDENLIPFLKTFSFVIPVWIFSHLSLAIIRGYEKISAYSFIVNIFQNLAKLTLLILFILIGIKTNAVPLSFLFGMLLMLFLAYLYCRYKLPEIFRSHNLKDNEKKKIISELFSYSWPLMFHGFMVSVFYWLDSFSVGFFMTTANVGFYNAAVPIALFLIMTPEIFMQLFFPLITREYSKKNFGVVRELSKQVGKWVFIINLPIFILIFVFPGAFINLLFGAEYLQAENALRLLSLGSFFFSIAIISQNLMSSIGKSKFVLYNLVFASIINLSLNIILVPRYGINGAAFSTSVSFIILGTLLFLESRFFLSFIPFRRKMASILFVSIIPLITLGFLQKLIETNIISLLLLVMLFFLIYFLLIFLSKSLDKNDINTLKSLIKRPR